MSARQVSSQNPGTDFISARIPATSETLAGRITSTSSTGRVAGLAHASPAP